MNTETEQILLGSMCGDGYIGIATNHNTPHFSEGHCLEQKDYLLWKKSYLEEFYPKFYEYRKSCSIYTRCSKDFIKYREMFYAESNDKKLTEEAIFSLKPLGLAIWYMDDGTYNYANNSCVICSNVYSRDINEFIVRYLNEICGISSAVVSNGIVKGRQRYNTRIYRCDTENFLTRKR
jgi:hypothetical protein